MTQERNIRLYMFLRLALLFSVLISLALFQRSGMLAQETVIKTYFVTFFTFLVTTAFVFLYEKARNVRYFLASQVAYDILFTTVLTFYTGPYESMYTVFYVFNILFAASMFPRSGAILAAITSAGLYALIAWLNPGKGSDERTFSMLTTLTGFVSLSLLGAQLVEELRKSRQRINRLEELSEEIVDSLDSGLLALDSASRVRKANRTALQMLDFDRVQAVLGKHIQEVLPVLGDFSYGGICELNIQGKVRRMLVTKVRLPENHTMVLLRDLSEVLNLEEKVRRQERLASVGRLATGIAHEVRNPLASISGAAQLLGSTIEDQAELQRLANLIVRESERVDRLVSQLLRFAKPAAVRREEIDVGEVLSECIEAVRARPDFKDIDVELKLAVSGRLKTKGNRDELIEVVTNLLVNSMQAFLEQNGSRPKELRIEGRKTRDRVEIVIADNGPGIPREFRERVFDPFFTTKPAGTGLGLAQVHKIIRDHDGQVDLETEEGKGTALKISLPA